MYRYLFILPLFFLLVGCGEGSNQRPYIAGQKTKPVAGYRTGTDPAVKIATIEAESRKEVATIQMQRDLELERIKKESKTEEVTAKKEIAFKEQDTIERQEDNINNRYNTIVIIGSLFLLVAMGLLVYFLLKRREDKLKMHEDTIEKEMTLKEKELQVQMATKILDTIASGTLDKEEERRLIETFEKSNKSLPYKKKF
ncbi:MAG: hypothetical protein U9Q62_04425 [Campylobacterota bacterium]|nr:hypothetical protein [Campylobacterota bacterium]